MTRTINAMALASVLILSVVAFSGTVGTSYATNAFPDRDDKPKQFKNDHDDEFHGNQNTCPSQSFLAEPHLKGAKQILDVSLIAQNDEDSGVGGGFWALDHFKEHLQVWKLADNSFYVLKKYDGIFVSPEGGHDPGTGTHLQNESSFGEITGGYVATMNGTFAPGANPTHGNIGTFNYGGTMADILKPYGTQTGAPNAYDWASAYFSSTSDFNQIHWGWSYKLDPEFQSNTSVNQWCNYNDVDGGNSGNILS